MGFVFTEAFNYIDYPYEEYLLTLESSQHLRHMQMIMLVSLKFSYWNKNVERERESNIGLKSYMTSTIN